ncbi:MAG: hypothetical protein NVV62_10185 [Terricaulis sp.]|nr:hypothetical protein [Terricaulis sp.]
MSNENEHAPETPTQAEAEADPGEVINAAYFEAELAKARDETLRALADAENTRRRSERQAQEARAYADRSASPPIFCQSPIRLAARSRPRPPIGATAPMMGCATC